MTAHLRPVPDPVSSGEQMAAVAALWLELVESGPSLNDLAGVTFTPDQGGHIVATFTDLDVFYAWTEHLGLAFTTAHPADADGVRYVALGTTTRSGRTALVELECTQMDSTSGGAA